MKMELHSWMGVSQWKGSCSVRWELPSRKGASNWKGGFPSPNCREDASKLWEENFQTVGGSSIAVRGELPDSKSW